MKKLICFFLFAVCISFQGFSQTEKGNFLIGGSAGFSHSTYNDSKSTSFSLAPSVSYFFADKFAAGLTTPLSFGSTSGPANLEISSSSFAIGPTVRYYFLFDDKWAIFPVATYSYGWVSNTSSADGFPESSSKSTRHSFSGGAGLTYFIANNVGIEGILRYGGQGSSVLDGDQNTLDFSIGLQVYINRKK